MKINRKGLFRLWLVLSVIWTLGAAYYQFNSWATEWANIDSLAYKNCYGPYGLKLGETIDQCLNSAGVNVNYFAREHTTALAWWGGAFGVAFVADLVLTALLIGIFYIARWVVRGFRTDASV